MTPDPKPTEALKPCPLCSGISSWIVKRYTNTGTIHGHKIRCESCGLEIESDVSFWTDGEEGRIRKLEETKAELAIRWNTRATDRDAELAAMREALNQIGHVCGIGGDRIGAIQQIVSSALASTAGTELSERLRLAVEERDQARIERDTEQQFRQRSDAKLAAVTAERDEEKAIVDRVWKALGISTYEQAKPFAIDEHVTRLRDRAAAAESVSAGLRKERDELQEMLRQIPKT